MARQARVRGTIKVSCFIPAAVSAGLCAWVLGVIVEAFVSPPGLVHPPVHHSWKGESAQRDYGDRHNARTLGLSGSSRRTAAGYRDWHEHGADKDTCGEQGGGGESGDPEGERDGGVCWNWAVDRSSCGSSGDDENVGQGMDRGAFSRLLVGMGLAGPLLGGVGGIAGGAQRADAVALERLRLGTPILTESVLLDLLPISGRGAETLRNIQAEIEKATILRTLYRRANTTTTPGNVVEQLQVPASVWDRVQAVAEGSLAILDDSRSDLDPVFRSMDTAEVQIRRAEYGEQVLSETKTALKKMAEAAVAKRPPLVLSAQEDALLGLGRIGELLIAGFPFAIKAGDTFDSIPRLLGRATVEMTMRREPENLAKGKAKVLGNITMVVDGFSSPVTAGNFIDLTLRGFYNELPVRFDEVPEEATVGGENNRTLATMVAGSYRDGFVDPSTGQLRRVPLEVLRVERSKNVPVYSAARNTKVFTKSPPVQTFRIPGAIAMNHPPLDGNGGSSEFFWLRDENLEREGFLMGDSSEVLDTRYTIFGYVVGNRRLLGRLRDGDVIEKMMVTYGNDNLIRPKATSFTDILLNGGGQDNED